MEGIDASGLPNGTILGGGSPASGTFTPPADTTWNSLWRWVTLSNAYTPTRGEKLALTIRHSAGTVNASNNSTFTLRFTTAAAEVFAFPYGLTLTAGTWAKVAVDVPIFAIRTANQRYGMLIQSLFSTTVTTTGHRSAMRFTLPATWAETFAMVVLWDWLGTVSIRYVAGESWWAVPLAVGSRGATGPCVAPASPAVLCCFCRSDCCEQQGRGTTPRQFCRSVVGAPVMLLP